MVVKKLVKKAAGVKKGKWRSVDLQGPLGTPRNVKVDSALGGRVVKKRVTVRGETDVTSVYVGKFDQGIMMSSHNVDGTAVVIGKKQKGGKLTPGIFRFEKRKASPTVMAYEPKKSNVVGDFSKYAKNIGDESDITRLSIGPLGKRIDIWKEKGTEISSTGTRKYDNIGISGRVGTKSFGKTISTRKAKAIGMGGTAAAAGYFGLESNKRGKR